MCLFVLTKGDGTLFDASSILEENIIEICFWFGHTYHEGQLQFSTIKSVVLFHTMDKLQIMAHGVVKASMLPEEAIRVRTSPPSATHVQAYMAVVNGEPSGAQCLSSNEEEEPPAPPSNPHSGGRTHNTCKQTLGTLQIMSWNSSWRISTGRSHSES